MQAKFIECAIIAASGILATTAAVPAADLPFADVPLRAEIIALPTMDMTTQQFLTGSEGTPAIIAAELLFPQSGTAPYPAVILMHGGGGLTGGVAQRARDLTELGFAVLRTDSMSGRGGPANVGWEDIFVDAYAGLAFLASKEAIDPNRIIVYGNSRSGTAALYSAMERFDRLWNKSGIDFAGHISFYPSCNITFLEETVVSDKPIRVFIGALDDLAPVEQCEAYAERVRAAGPADIVVTGYPGGHHVFDSPIRVPTMPSAEPALSPNSVSPKNCPVVEDASGALINTTTGLPFSREDACLTRGATFGYNAEAAGAAVADLVAFLAPFAPIPSQ